MKKIIISLEHEHFIVHLEKDVDNRCSGYVYPIDKYDGSMGVDYGYLNTQDGGHLDDENGARCLFGFLFCDRGVWEGRIYFKDDEYWSEELETMKIIWDKLEVILKQLK